MKKGHLINPIQDYAHWGTLQILTLAHKSTIEFGGQIFELWKALVPKGARWGMPFLYHSLLGGYLYHFLKVPCCSSLFQAKLQSNSSPPNSNVVLCATLVSSTNYEHGTPEKLKHYLSFPVMHALHPPYLECQMGKDPVFFKAAKHTRTPLSGLRY